MKAWNWGDREKWPNQNVEATAPGGSGGSGGSELGRPQVVPGWRSTVPEDVKMEKKEETKKKKKEKKERT